MTEKLNRHIGLGALAIFGIGDILGAGIYGLVGKAAGEMGNAVWMAFAASMVAAGLTGLSYASLGSRYPKSGGAAYISHLAFRNKFLAYVVGLAALASGITSMATGSRAFAGYFVARFGLTTELVIVGFCFLVAGVVIRGIKESMWMNIICTGIELSGLLIILAVGLPFLGSVNYMEANTVANPTGDLTMSLLLSGAVLTFYSFIGFEDIINVAEEVKNPTKNIPLGLLLAVSVSSVIYMGISLVSVSVIPAPELAKSSAPLVDVVGKAAPWFPKTIFSFIAMFAVANTALLNFIMGSRLVYGMANDGLLPSFLGKVSTTRRTPHVAAGAILCLMLILALSGDISSLARATSVLLLCVFVVVNLSLITLKLRKGEPRGSFEVPVVVPALGAVVCFAMLFFAKPAEIQLAGIILTGIVVLYLLVRPRNVLTEAA